ncbi:AMP-binding protein [Sporosarcina limicola]|uniref:Acyl-CoA synthetase (AMP-forming)/AMP-acid ligase II n=1 Tax=Sporosarcina limicola TaxID=34101 RepID=A0A927R4Y9_9BACL|nr:AMP-binding protein [Sporosarcina limicola]MBE1555423.1 acyl-CoA synthetase (AMP-forming)/AMP-acid ligase II [Sporosarcina limicola]
MSELKTKENLLINDLLFNLKDEKIKGHHFFNNKEFEFESYSTLVKNAFKFGSYLNEQAVVTRSVCLLYLTTPKEILTCFYGAISKGFIPLILPAIKALSGKEVLLERIKEWHLRFEKNSVLVIGDDESLSIEQLPKSLRVILFDHLDISSQNIEIESPLNRMSDFVPSSNDIAYIQLTSASTGKSKGVAISHRNVIHNVSGITEASRLTKGEFGCSWLPLYHDMGLVGAEIFCLYNNYSLVLMSPYNFLRKPLRWLEAIDQFKCTLSPAPNFAYSYCCDLIKDDKLTDLDLSSWKVAYNGSEPINVDTLTRFNEKFKRYGYKSSIMTPVYGLAENTLGVTFDDVQAEANFLVIERKNIAFNKKVKIVEEVFDYSLKNYSTTGQYLTAFSLGKSLSGQFVYIVDEEGIVINHEETIGQVVVRGNSVALGYITQESIDFELKEFNGAVETGDIGFIRNKKLYVIERIKNIIIKNGENYFANDLETQLSRSFGIDEGRIAVFEVTLNNSSNIVALIEARTTEEAKILNNKSRMNLSVDLPINSFIFVKKGQIPKTSSGKKQHFKCRALLVENNLSIINVES